jgi:hypothetical protein
MTIEQHIANLAGVTINLVRQYILRRFVTVDGEPITPEQGREPYTGQQISVNNKGGNCLSSLDYQE